MLLERAAGADARRSTSSPILAAVSSSATSWSGRSQFGDLSRRFKLGRAVLVASPNEGTPLATPKRWDETIGWIANLLEMFPDNPFTTGAAFVANGLVWLANHASGDLPGLQLDGWRGRADRGDSGSAGSARRRILRAGRQLPADRTRCCSVCWMSASISFSGPPTTWSCRRRADGASIAPRAGFIPASRIGCFGPGGNLPPDSVTHVSFFSHPETVDFLVNALLGRQQPLNGVDPRKGLPDRRLLRGGDDGRRRAPGQATGRMLPSRACSAAAPSKAPDEEPLRITVTNGDLTFEPEALLLGHYQRDAADRHRRASWTG